MKETKKLASPDYEKYEGIVIQESPGIILGTLRQLSNFDAPKLAIVAILLLALAILWKSELNVTVQIVMVLAVTVIGVASAIERKSNAAPSSHNGKGPLELGHARRNKGTT